MAELNGTPGELRFTIEVVRAATGKTEKYDMIGKVMPDGGNSLNSGTRCRN